MVQMPRPDLNATVVRTPLTEPVVRVGIKDLCPVVVVRGETSNAGPAELAEPDILRGRVAQSPVP
jgi:hypothetical protein